MSVRSVRSRWILCTAAAVLIAAGAAVAGAQPTAADNGMLGVAAPGSPSAPVPVGGNWLEFLFTAAGVPATDCAGVCTPSSGGNAQDAGSPPWTFSAGAGGADLTVVDAFILGDQFEVFDFGLSMGTTSAPGAGICGSDPVPCLADTNASQRVFQLAPGAHSITITPVLSPVGGGAAYFRVDDAQRFTQAIPTLGAVGLGVLVVALALISLLVLRRRRAHSH